ncbi:MAG: hypothetical protein IPM91_18300 [Bacteroidetes bacterium]|nr:hypothetical protein [Bacteroidota bacterium]
MLTFYADADGDSYGNAPVSVQACVAPLGYVADATDCDDTATARCCTEFGTLTITVTVQPMRVWYSSTTCRW